jgi:hypothetical protein
MPIEKQQSKKACVQRWLAFVGKLKSIITTTYKHLTTREQIKENLNLSDLTKKGCFY